MKKKIGLMLALFLVGMVLFSDMLLLEFYVGSGSPIIQQDDLQEYPRLDTLYMVEAYPPSTARTMALECKIDAFLGSTWMGDIEALKNAGWNVTHSDGGLHYCYLGFNCRNVQPPWSQMWYDYHGRTPGFELYPLNISSFRHALPYIIGCEKTAWCWDIMYYLVVRIDFPMPPGFGEWRNPYIMEYPEDWAYAVDILLEGGFTYDVGPDGVLNAFSYPVVSTDDIWYMPNGQVLVGGRTSAHPGSDRLASPADGTKGIYVMSPGTSMIPIEWMRRHCKKWNKFFIGEELEGIDVGEWYALFHHDIMMDLSTMIETVWYNRNHDIFYLCNSFRRPNPDFLFNIFHSSQDVEDGDNDPGLVNEGLDKMLYSIKYFKMVDYEILAGNFGEDPEMIIPASTHYTIKQPADVKDVKIERCNNIGVYYEYLVQDINYTLVGADLHILTNITLYPGDALEINYNPDTYLRGIYDIDELRFIVWLADWKIFYLNPQIGVYGRDYFDLFKPGLTDWVESQGYGSGPYQLEMPWTYCNIHWQGQPVGGSMKWQVPGNVVTLNPTIATQYRYYNIIDLNAWMILNRIYDSLIVMNASTHRDMPWVAECWATEPYANETEGVTDGIAIRFLLRNDTYWQDGKLVTPEDIKFSWDFIKTNAFRQFQDLWSVYIRSETMPNPPMITCYVNATGPWWLYSFANSSLLFPPQIWQPFWNDPEGAMAFEPWAVSYTDWTGYPTPLGDDLTCLMGTGPFFLNLTAGGWNEVNQAVLSKNPDWWANDLVRSEVYAHDVKTQITTSKTIVRDGFNVSLNLLVLNHGENEEIINVTVYADPNATITGDEIVICNKTNIQLQAHYYTTFNLVWNTSGFAKGNYTIIAYAWPVPGETNTVDNKYTDGLVTVTIQGDCAGSNPMAPPWCDGKVFWQDLLVELVVYGATPSDPRWTTYYLERADFNSDNQISWQDLSIVLVNYGKFDC